jgi:Mrp family chromosome partitioning ATPase
MEPIQQALLRAREERRQARDARASEPRKKPDAPAPGAVISAADTVIRRTNTPEVKLDPEHLYRRRILNGKPDDPLTAPFDMLRTKVIQSMNANGWHSVAVLSAEEDEGKTVSAINLALSVAKLPSQTAMLLDLDFRRPGLLSTLGHTPRFCIEDWLSGACDFSQTLFSPQSERLVASGVRAPIAGAAEVLASNRVANQIDESASRYDDRVVIIDMPPILRNDDALVLLPRIDCFLLVVAAGQSLGNRVQECLELIPGDRLLGTVLNKSIR